MGHSLKYDSRTYKWGELSEGVKRGVWILVRDSEKHVTIEKKAQATQATQEEIYEKAIEDAEEASETYSRIMEESEKAKKDAEEAKERYEIVRDGAGEAAAKKKYEKCAERARCAEVQEEVALKDFNIAKAKAKAKTTRAARAARG